MIHKFDRRLKDISSNIWSKIARIDEMKGRWSGALKLNPYTLARLQRSVLITSTGASTRIEGAGMTDGDIEKMLRGISIQKFSDRDRQEVRGYFEILQNIFNSWQEIRFSENTIKHFHQELLKYVKKDTYHKGQYKKTENKVEMIDREGKSIGVLFDTTPAYLAPYEMQELVEWTKKALKEKKYHPLLIIGNFIVEFLNIHPFTDGNGRLSRILTNLLLLQSGYLYMPYVSHEKLIEDNKPDYYLSLRKSQKTFKGRENITNWLEFFLAIILKQSEAAIELLSQDSIESLLSTAQLKVWQSIDKAQEISPREIAVATGVARPTINQALTKLLSLKRIERIGQGRATVYRKMVV